MGKYTATAPVTLPVGAVLGLTEVQASARRHALQAAKKRGIYTTTAPVQFKAGEVFHYDGDLPKALASSVEADAVAAKAEAKAAAEAAAQAKAEALAASQQNPG